jgi:competence ComEA-like helix-hairpin-helix protein
MTESEHTPVDINQASLVELTTVHGIGPSLAERIIAYRPYTEIDEIVKVPGINQIKLKSLKPFIMLTPPKTASPSPTRGAMPINKLGNTETFVFLEDRNERQDALLIVFGGFILGLIILMLRRSKR